MIICGIDPAVRNIGLVIGEVAKLGDKPQILFAETYRTKTQEKRSSTFYEGEYDVLCAHHLTGCILQAFNQWKPEFIAVEVGFGSRSRAAANGLGVAKGLIGALMAFYPTTYAIVEPEEAKAVVVKGADKTIIQAWVKENFQFPWNGKKCEFEHQADAVAILIGGMRKYLMEQKNALSKPLRRTKPEKKTRKKRRKRPPARKRRKATGHK